MIWAAHILNPACQVFLEGSSLLKHHTLLQAVEEINIKKIHQKDKIVFLIDRLQWFFLPGLGQTQKGDGREGIGACHTFILLQSFSAITLSLCSLSVLLLG